MKKNQDTLRIGFRGRMMSATELLETLQQKLEPLVEPCIHHDRKRAILEGLFRGKPAYCSPKFPTHSRKGKMPPAELVWPAFDLLNLVYWLQDAYKCKDLEAVFCGAWYLAERVESFENVKEFGMPTFIIRAKRHVQRKNSAAGGRETRKLTPPQEKLAESIFREVKRSKVSDEKAYVRTISRLNSEHQIDIHRGTIRRLIKASRLVQ